MDDSASTPVEGIDVEAVSRWFAQQVPTVVGPLSFQLIAGGNSNLTYVVHDAAGSTWVLRRPPMGKLLPRAHDMAREAQIMGALEDTPVPVPTVVGLCTDEAVNGPPFYVMTHIEGHVFHTIESVTATLDPQARRRAGEDLVDTLAAIHSVDVDAVGLGDYGRREGYAERQLSRWHSQFEKSKTREIPAIDEVHRILSSHIPPQGPPGIVHGDYRLANCLTTTEGRIAAVLDWELSTLGDPLADLGQLLVYWGDIDAGDTISAAPTQAEGFLSGDDVVQRYATASGRDVSAVDFFTALGFWRLGCIVEGVYARYMAGVMSDDRDKSEYAAFARQVDGCAEAALTAARRL
jgi:aminoglycoside phosphotransferase (APT) family kinase protein